jgi:2-polyprenyl-3-methyl-5-hydroxy-6-metoxy-1,4-benzoquinol methylase
MSELMNECICCGQHNQAKKYAYSDLRYRPGSEYEYLSCSACNCIFLKEYKVLDISSFYYSSYETHKKTEYKRVMKHLIPKILFTSKMKIPYFYELFGSFSNWVSLVGRNKKLLDVGAGGGYFAEKMSAFEYDVSIVEPDIKAHSWSIKSVGEKYNHISELDRSKFDVITFNHTIEHMIDARYQIKKAFDLLNDQGRIIILTPNFRSALMQKYTRYHWHLDAPRHVCLYGPDSIKKMLKFVDIHNVNIRFCARSNDTCFLKTMSEKSLNKDKRPSRAQVFLAFSYKLLGFLTSPWIGNFSEEMIVEIKK